MEIPFLTGEEDLSDATVARVAERLAESGAASGGEEAADMIREAVSEQAIGQFRSQVVEFAQRSEEQKAFGCPHDPLYDKFEAYDAGMPVPFPPVAFDIGGKTVRIVGSFRPPAILTNSAGNPLLGRMMRFQPGFAIFSKSSRLLSESFSFLSKSFMMERNKHGAADFFQKPTDPCMAFPQG